MILLSFQFTFPVGANGRHGKQLVVPPDHKKSQSPKTTVNPLGGVTAGRASIDDARRTCRGSAHSVHSLTTGNHTCRHQHKLSSTDHHFLRGLFLTKVSILKYQTDDNAAVNIVASIITQGKDISHPKSGLHPPNRIEIQSKTGIAEQTVLTRLFLV